VPLAIELAAARLGTLSAEEIEAHLADRFRFLAYHRPVADLRHQALRAAMGWSYDLLSAEERRVLAELSVFAETFALAQAAEVCSGRTRVRRADPSALPPGVARSRDCNPALSRDELGCVRRASLRHG
jgi:predicted ATPase